MWDLYGPSWFGPSSLNTPSARPKCLWFLGKTIFHIWLYFCSSLAKIYSPRSWPGWLSPIHPLRLSISMQLPPFKNYFQIPLLVFHIFSLYIQKSLHLPYYIIISIYMSVLLNGWGREAYKWEYSRGRSMFYSFFNRKQKPWYLAQCLLNEGRHYEPFCWVSTTLWIKISQNPHTQKWENIMRAWQSLNCP